LIRAQSLITEALHELRPGGGGSIVPIVELRRFLEFKLAIDPSLPNPFLGGIVPDA